MWLKRTRHLLVLCMATCILAEALVTSFVAQKSTLIKDAKCVSGHSAIERCSWGFLQSYDSAKKDTIILFSKTAKESGYDRRGAIREVGNIFLHLAGCAIALGASHKCEAVELPASSISTIAMKDFRDPAGLFNIRVPQSYFVLRRSSKGDLPDSKTGQGRRGSSIFSAGDMTKAEVVAIERYPVKALLEDEGIDSSGDLSTFSNIGKPNAIVNLITKRRDQGRNGQKAQTEVLSVAMTPDAKTLEFTLRTTIEVMKPELLMEQTGMSELVRYTLAKATLASNDGQLMAVFASALQPDFDGPDGNALKEVVSSFAVIDQSSINQKS
mmetsp:Transcript_5520/g.8141  ORF Transcript_5520/g.8141 Transcript_5520/m.8141 type:complete len:326 (+) Transcript_5520:2-979(+)